MDYKLLYALKSGKNIKLVYQYFGKFLPKD